MLGRHDRRYWVSISFVGGFALFFVEDGSGYSDIMFVFVLPKVVWKLAKR